MGNISENLISGFKATGKNPCNRQVILDKFPREVDETIVNDTLTTYLKSQRFDKTDKNQKRKKKSTLLQVKILPQLFWEGQTVS